MSPEQLTAIGGLLVSVLTAVIVPIYVSRSNAKKELELSDVQSWQNLTVALQAERDSVQKRIKEIETDYQTRMRQIETDYQERLRKMEETHTRQQAMANERIQQLEAEVVNLYRRFNRSPDSGQ